MAGIELTAKQVADLPLGMHWVSPNLYLRSLRPTASSWVFIYNSRVTGKRREMGLGPYPLVTVPSAKAQALCLRLELLAGNDPLDDRQSAQAAKKAAARPAHVQTFAAVAELYLAAHEPKWRHPKQAIQWRNSLANYAFPILGHLPVEAVATGHIMEALEAIWHQKPETASRVRGRIEAILDYATARHWRAGDNPARWRGHIASLLPARDQVKPTEHFVALPWREMPQLWERLAAKPDISAIALRFVMATAVRTNEALGMKRDEVDFAAKVWTVPGSRTKTKRDHRVPLSTAALQVLEAAEALRTSNYQFSGYRSGQPLSNMALLMMLRRLRPDENLTVHGMRSSFRDWAAENGIAREIAEAALAHVVENQVERAYLRADLLEPRRIVMERWAHFLSSPASMDNVRPLRAAEG
jgi:integrase